MTPHPGPNRAGPNFSGTPSESWAATLKAHARTGLLKFTLGDWRVIDLMPEAQEHLCRVNRLPLFQDLQ